MSERQGTLTVRYGVRSDIGLHREDNEDAAYAEPGCSPWPTGWAAADGELASAAVIDALRPLDIQIPAGELMDALDHAGAGPTARCAHGRADPALHGMGTTLTALLWPAPARPGAHRRLAGLPGARRECSRAPRTNAGAVAAGRGQDHGRGGRVAPAAAAAPAARSPASRGSRPTSSCARPAPATATCSAPTACTSWCPRCHLRVLLTVTDPDQAAADLLALALTAAPPTTSPASSPTSTPDPCRPPARPPRCRPPPTPPAPDAAHLPRHPFDPTGLTFHTLPLPGRRLMGEGAVAPIYRGEGPLHPGRPRGLKPGQVPSRHPRYCSTAGPRHTPASESGTHHQAPSGARPR